MRYAFFVSTLLASSMLLSTAFAAEDVEKAKALFNAGAKAYSSARYVVAIESFREAYRIAPRPAILFSLGQAYRRQYAVDGNLKNLEQAIATFRLYLEQVKEGGRRADATQALGELEVLAAARLPRTPDTGATQAPPPAAIPVPVETKPKTHLTITSPTPGARVSLDGGKPVEVPLSEDVTPGTHKYEITADGFIDEEREIKVTEGDQFAIERELRDKPALLDIEGPPGVTVAIDGRFVGTTPLPTQELDPGARFVALSRNGYKPYSRELDLSRGKRDAIKPEFSRTPQRITSYFFFGASTIGLLVGLGQSLSALGYEGTAKEALEGGIDESELAKFNQAIADRDNARTIAATAFGVGTALGVTGFVLYAFDQPQLTLPPARKENKPAAPPSDKGTGIDAAALPAIGPGFAGAVVVGRF